jgi:hypothetical protein
VLGVGDGDGGLGVGGVAPSSAALRLILDRTSPLRVSVTCSTDTMELY